MNAHGAVPGWLRALARLCLGSYPASFRRQHAAAYHEAVTHRWLCERDRASGLVAALRTARVLLADTFVAAPAAHAMAHREARAARRKRTAQREAGTARRQRDDARPTPELLGARGAERAPVLPEKRSAEYRLNRRQYGTPAWLTSVATGAAVGAAMDARVAIRSLAKRPGFTALVVLTLGLGIGANAAIFGALDRIVLRPLPYADGDRMVYIALHHPQLGWNIAPRSEAVARWRASARTLEWIETFVPDHDVVWTGERSAQLLTVTAVSARLPAALGVSAVVGRIPLASDLEPSDPPVVMLAEGFWRQEFGGDAGVVGRTLTLNDSIFTIAGVWPAAARLEHGRVPDIFRVLPRDALYDEDAFGLVLALVREGATASDVESELRALAPPPDGREGFVPVVNAPHWLIGEAYVQGVWLVFGGVVVLMLVALANTVNLLLNRTVSRAGELGVRAAVGGSRAALARLFLIESLALTLLGVAAAAVIARAGGTALASLVVERIVILEGAARGPRVFVYAGLLAAAAAFICALVPALQLRSLDVRSLLGRADAARSGGGRSGWTRQLLVAIQVGLAVVLITGSALTLRSFHELMSVDVGMAVEQLAEFSIQLPESRYPTPEAQGAFWDRVLVAVESIPGVKGVTTSAAPLMSFNLYGGAPYLDGEPRPVQAGAFSYGNHVPAGYFAVTGVRLLQGRDFDRTDGERVAIVNNAFARGHGGNVLGRRLLFHDGSTFYTIIGVAGDVMDGGQRANPHRLQFYTPSFERDDDSERFIVRTSGDPAALFAAMRARLAELDPDLPLRNTTTGTQELRDDTARQRFVAQILAVFGTLALLLAVTGVYGVVALDVSRRTREVGIRVALGASGRRVVRDVLAVGLRPVAFGIVAGTLASMWAVRYVEGMLYRISTTDPLSIATGIGLLLVAATAACVIPARRASGVDPIRALRSE